MLYSCVFFIHWNFKINIRQIRAFHASIVSGSVSKAAITLGLTQPAVSKLLKNLEETLGYKLFERINGRINPTPQASYLFQEVDSILSQMDRLDNLFESVKTLNNDRIKIGSIAGPSNFFIPNVLGKFLKTHNNISTTLITRGSTAISDSISCQMLDIGLIDVTGISKRFALYQCNGIDNCEALTFRGIRYIFYDANFMKSISMVL